MLAPDQESAAGKTGIKTTQHYSVSIISGSRALGLEQLEQVLPSIDDFSLEWAQKYALKPLVDTDFNDLTYFNNRLRRTIGHAKTTPQFILINITGERSAEELSSMLDIAHQAKEEFHKGFFPCKVIFALSSKGLWNWLSSGQDVAAQERALPHICLGLWKRVAMRAFLEQLGLPNTPVGVEALIEYTAGWYIPIHRLSCLKRDNTDVTTMKRFGARFKKITELTVKESQQFLALSGATDMPWAIPLLQKLLEGQGGKNFNTEDIKIIIMEDMDGLNEDTAEQALEWLTRLSLVEVMPITDRSKPLLYQLNSAVASCLVKAYE